MIKIENVTYRYKKGKDILEKYSAYAENKSFPLKDFIYNAGKKVAGAAKTVAKAAVDGIKSVGRSIGNGIKSAGRALLSIFS